MKRVNELFDIDSDIKIEDIYSDSRYVTDDSIFFCIDGFTTDGHKYAEDAVFQGAKVIVHSKPLRRRYKGIIYIEVPNVLDELNRVADIFFDHPSYKLTTVGVTGSSGKTVVTRLFVDIMQHYLKMGYIGTNTTVYGEHQIKTNFTTPNTIFLHRHMANMVKEDVKGVALEVSSYGLTLKRVDGIHFSVGVLTNISNENLEIHGTQDNLMSAYMKLFELLDDNAFAIINADETRFNFIYEQRHFRATTITYGIDHQADVMARHIQLYIDHSEFDLIIGDRMMHVSIPLLGRFNISNFMAVVCILLTLDMPHEQLIECIQYIHPIDGRMELLYTNQPFHVVIDNSTYSSNYEDVLKFANEVKGRGRIIAVFGAPGKRQFGLREKLGRLVDEYCDLVILTAQDARDDDVEAICEEIQEYIKRPQSIIIIDRRVAIYQAIELACKDDIILLLGKGEEQFMRAIDTNEPYPGDKFIAKKAIKEVFEGGSNYEF
ncbi:MAG: UDP-N-acetylmuramoyl-L-alanyl-D-glutamate--2,6-diaminopimelate ligase [Erysipelotrichaceae bacterium]|nr:UDP-N-acetylmuramoyl-L-alanyl-D-glutamate--2,6-diaminopimelate ligase [Erysipelotrichaceae bacterium]